MAVVTSYGLTAAVGYLLYTYAGRQSESRLSIIVRFVFYPLSAVLTGVLVGFLSKDDPILPTTAGLTPWAITLG